MELQDLIYRFVEDANYFGEDQEAEVEWTIDYDNNAVDLKVDGKKFRVTFEEV